MTHWRVESYEGYEKDLFLVGPEELRVSIDWDDVDRMMTALELRKMLWILNKYWDTPEFEFKSPNESIPEDNGDGKFEEYWDKRYEDSKALMRMLTE